MHPIADDLRDDSWDLWISEMITEIEAYLGKWAEFNDRFGTP